MNDQIKDFLLANRIGVIAILNPEGAPHAATVHFAYDEQHQAFYISTDRSTKKCEALLDGKTVKASFVVGFNEEELLTFQTDGEACILTNETAIETFKNIYYAKFPQHRTYKKPTTAFIKFTIDWWRFSDYSEDKPKITESH